MDTPVMPDGRELDAWVAEHVLGWKWFQAPMYDANGPLPEQGKVLVPPDLIPKVDSGEYQWPPNGLIAGYAFLYGGRETAYSTNTEADYRVLCAVRNTWKPKEFEKFYHSLWWTWTSRQDKDQKATKRDISSGWGAMPTYYEPGDYAKAAWQALNREGLYG